jgi:hypothetical protein
MLSAPLRDAFMDRLSTCAFTNEDPVPVPLVDADGYFATVKEAERGLHRIFDIVDIVADLLLICTLESDRLELLAIHRTCGVLRDRALHAIIQARIHGTKILASGAVTHEIVGDGVIANAVDIFISKQR